MIKPKPHVRIGITSPLKRLQQRRVSLMAARFVAKEAAIQKAIKYREERVVNDIQRVEDGEQ